jgi:anti-sigma regulatory factor (Ser/Thr protein kinase)
MITMQAQAGAAETQAFHANAADIGEMDRWVEELGVRWGIPERTVFRARVCIAEIAANVLEHGAARPGGDQIIVTLRDQAPAVEIEIADTGKAFNPVTPQAGADAAAAQSATEGGRGLQLLRSYASAIDYKRERDRNILLFRVLAV